MKIAIVAGGTGGHIYPALTLGEELRNRGHEVVFFGSNDRMEKDVVPAKGFEYIGIDVYTTRGSLIQKARSLFSILLAYQKCRKILKGYDLAIGFGNYISVPVIMAASKLGLKTAIHEQNSFVGRANLMLDKKVDLIIGSYKENLKQFKNPNVHILGNPQASKAYSVVEDKMVLSDMGLDPNKKTAVIFMGSLGSESVMKVLLDYFDLTKGDYQIIYATGKSHYDYVMEHYHPQDHIRVYERIDGASLMKNCDLLVSRAGATTLCEITAIGTPSILIPSPFVPNNHQYFNAMALVNEGAATLLEEKELTPIKLEEKIEELIHDDVKLKTLHDSALKLGNDHVLSDIVKKVEELC